MQERHRDIMQESYSLFHVGHKHVHRQEWNAFGMKDRKKILTKLDLKSNVHAQMQVHDCTSFSPLQAFEFQHVLNSWGAYNVLACLAHRTYVLSRSFTDFNQVLIHKVFLPKGTISVTCGHGLACTSRHGMIPHTTLVTQPNTNHGLRYLTRICAELLTTSANDTIILSCK